MRYQSNIITNITDLVVSYPQFGHLHVYDVRLFVIRLSTNSITRLILFSSRFTADKVD